MKKILLFSLVCAGALAAQAQISTPAPTPKPALTLTGSSAAAAQYAQQMVAITNYSLTALKSALENGIPAKNGKPAIAAADFQAQLGTENVDKLHAIFHAAGLE